MTAKVVEPGQRILDVPQVVERTTLSRATIFTLMDAGEFPRRFKLSEGRKGWLESDIDNWIADRAKGNR